MFYRDDGDCNDRFIDARRDALHACDRRECNAFEQDYFDGLRDCYEACFKASCDWSNSVCSIAKSHISKCPLFDAAVFKSFRSQNSSPTTFLKGGTARYVFSH